MQKLPVVGVVSFADPRAVSLKREAENYNRRSHREIVEYLKKNNCIVIDPCEEMFGRLGLNDKKKFFGVRTNDEIEKISRKLIQRDAECIIIGCWKWTEPMLVTTIVRKLNIPVLLFANSDPAWTGLGCMSAVGASLHETSPNRHALNHRRVYGNKEEVLKWVRGVCALQKMKESSFLLWGGTYCLRMEHLQDNIPFLKSFLVGDILQEDQYVLIKKAEEILKSKPARIDNFISWLEKNKVKITYDKKMLTEDSLKCQIALYLAAKNRFDELRNENIAGVSIKCQPELSEEYGVTACFLPAFLPFPEDSEGEKNIVSCVCEGDIKGLLTSAMLNFIEPQIPALFGDIREVRVNNKRILGISNCGAASIYYAANSCDAKKVLPNLSLKGQCQGKSGAAVGFLGKGCKVTIARLGRIDREYEMQFGCYNMLDVKPEMLEQFRWAKMWPMSIVDAPIENIAERTLSNHYSLIPGDFTQEIQYFCNESGIKSARI